MHPQQIYPVPTPVHTLQLYLLHLMYVTRLSDVQLSRDYKWSPPSAEHHLTFDAAVSVSPTHVRDRYIAVCMMSSFSSVGLRGFLFLQCRQLNLCIGQQWRDGVLRTTVSQHHCGTYGTVPTHVYPGGRSRCPARLY